MAVFPSFLICHLLTQSHRGGGRVKNTETGAMVRTKDAPDTASNVRAIMNAYRNNTLVAVIAGKLCGISMRSLDHGC
jgi:hypothetical protein